MSKAILIRWLFRRRAHDTPLVEHWSLVEPAWKACRALWNPVKPQGPLKPSYNLTSNHPRGTLLEPCWNGTLPCNTWWNSGGILMEHYLKPARTAGGILVKPWWNPRGTFPEPRRTLEEIGGTLVEPLSGARRAGGTLVQTGGTLVEPYLKPPQTTPPLQNLVEPWWNPGGTMVEPWWNPGGTLVEPLVEPWWNLSSGSPRTTPEPIWAETPKLSAVGEKWKHWLHQLSNLPPPPRQPPTHPHPRHRRTKMLPPSRRAPKEKAQTPH